MVTGTSTGSRFPSTYQSRDAPGDQLERDLGANQKGKLTEILKASGTSSLPPKSFGLESLDKLGEGGAGPHTNCPWD